VFQDGIVEQLYHRFEQNQIYTYIGDILVAVNPFVDLGLYTDVVSEVYNMTQFQERITSVILLC
jgi:myosin-3